MGLLDKAKAAAEQAAAKAKEGVEDVQTKRDLGQAYGELGRMTYRLVDSGELSNPELTTLVDRTRATAVNGGEITQAPPDPLLGAQVERLDDQLVHPPHFRSEDGDQHAVDMRVVAAELVEFAPVEGVGLGGLERCNGGRTGCVRHERQLAEGLARPADRQCGRIGEGCRDADCEPTLLDQVERVRGIALVEHDL